MSLQYVISFVDMWFAQWSQGRLNPTSYIM